MKSLQRALAERLDATFQRTHKALERYPGLRRMNVVVEGLRDSLFGGSDRRVREAPYLRDALGMQRYMVMPILAVLPATLAAIYFYGWRALAIIVVSYVFGGLTELVFSAVRQEEITEGFLVTGILYALCLPPTLPLWMVAVGVVFGVAIGKEIFGGTGHNIFNPALVGRAFLLVAFPVQMTTQWAEPFVGGAGGFIHYASDAVTKATPLVLMKFGDGVEPHVSTPFGELFWGTHAGSLGETSIFLLLLGGLFLLITRVIDWRVTVVMMATIGLAGQLLHSLAPETFAGDGLFQMMAGGALFAAIFNATDPVTSPLTPRGKWIFGIFLGLLTVLIRGLTGYTEGVTFAVLIGNMFTPLLDRFTVPKSLAGEARR